MLISWWQCTPLEASENIHVLYLPEMRQIRCALFRASRCKSFSTASAIHDARLQKSMPHLPASLLRLQMRVYKLTHPSKGTSNLPQHEHHVAARSLVLTSIQALAACCIAMLVSMGLHQLLRRTQPLSACSGQIQLQLRAFAAASGQLDAIKSLREITSAPITDVKKALVEASWDVGVP